MKQFTSIISVLAIAAMSASCAQEVVETSASGFKSEIRLSAGAVSSKGSETTSKEMKVSAYTESGRYFTDIYEMTGNMWEGSQKRYWPEESGRMTFYGYPCNVNLEETAQGIGFKWTVSEFGSQEDVKVAKAETTIGTSNVVLSPASVLSTIKFSVSGEDSSLEYKISKVEMQNVKSEGFYSFTRSEMTASEGSEMTFSIPAEGAVLYMLPQSISNVIVSVDYTVFQNGVKVGGGILNVSLSGLWRQGKTYDYSLTLPSNTQAISWIPSVSDWD